MRIAPLSSFPPKHRVDPALPTSQRSSARSRIQYHGAADSDDDGESDEDSMTSFYSTHSCASAATIHSNKSLTPPAPQHARRRHGCLERWLYRHPRIGFFLCLVLCAFTTGAYATYFFATWTLHFTGVPTALAYAHTQLVATEITLARTTECGLQQIPPKAVVLKTLIELETQPWRTKLEELTRVGLSARANFTVCREREIAKYEQLVAKNATTQMPRQQLACLAEGITRTLQTSSFSSSSSSSSPSSVPKLAQLYDRLTRVADVATTRIHVMTSGSETRQSVDALAANTTHSVLGVLDDWLGELTHSLETEYEAMASALRLKMAMAMPSDNGHKVTTTSGQGGGDSGGRYTTTSRLKDRLMLVLGKAAHSNRDVERVLDKLEASWDKMDHAVRQAEEAATRIQEQLADIQNATLVRMNETVHGFKMAISELQEMIAGKTRSAIHALAEEIHELVIADVQKRLGIEDRAQIDPAEAGRSVGPSDFDAGEPTTDWNWTHESLVPHFDALDNAIHELTLANANGIPRVKFAADAQTFRASLLDASAAVVTVIVTYDFLSRISWLFIKLAALLTESYTDLPPVDIRDITAITTLIDFWGVLKCRHDFGSVVYTLLTESAYVVQTAIHFVFWVLVEIAGTLGFVNWRREYVARCRLDESPAPHSSMPPTPAPVFVGVLQVLFGHGPKRAPLTVVDTHTAVLHDALQEDADNWQTNVDAVVTKHSTLVEELMLERRVLLELRANLMSCSFQKELPHWEDSMLDAGVCSLAAIDRSEDLTKWTPSTPLAFQSDKVHAILDPASFLASCLHHNDDPHAATATLHRLEHMRSCQVDQSLYLMLVTWWMLLVVSLALRFISRMLIKSAGMVFWRYLSGDRLNVLAYCDEYGIVQSPERLPKAVRRHLRNIRWRVTARMVGVTLALLSVVVIACVVLPSVMMLPLGPP